jgi:adenylate cyclase
LFLGVALAAAAVGIGIDVGGVLRSQEQATVDVRFSIRGAEAPPEDVAVVAIDDVTFDDLGIRWPFPRRLHAQMIDRLRHEGAKVIAYDIQFTEETTPRDDFALWKAAGRARNVVFSTTAVNAKGGTNVLGGDANLRAAHAVAANGLLPSDAGGVDRRVPFEIDKLKTFSVVAAERFSGRTIHGSDLGGSTAWIDYVGPPGTVRTYSFSQVLRGDVPADALRGKIVVVGVTTPTEQDVHPTSVSGDQLMSGPEIQANAIETALRGFPLKSLPSAINILLIVLLALVAPLAGLRFSPFRALLAAIAAGAVYAVVVQFAFNHGRVFAFVYPLIALGVSGVGTVALGAVLEAFERERVRDLFGRFVPAGVVDEVLAQTADGIHLGGKMRVCTMMFTDLRGFTTFSESRAPDEVIHILNYYFGEMSEAILGNGGTLVSYLGDGMMCVFGAPIEQEDHADRAVAAAREMILERLPRVNEWMREQGYGDGFRMGVGLNSGELMVGNIGSEQRMEYTTIGDIVNTASRLEGLTKGTPFPLFIGESTRSLLRHDPDGLVYVAELEVRGRNERVKVWSLNELVPGAAPAPVKVEAEAGVPAVAPSG